MTKDYISGFFDADGYLTMSRRHSNEESQPVLGFTNTIRPILKEIQNYLARHLKVKGVIKLKKSRNENHNDSFDLRYEGSVKVIQILSHIDIKHPKKRKRFALVLKINVLTPRNGKYLKEQLKERRQLCEQFLLTQG